MSRDGPLALENDRPLQIWYIVFQQFIEEIYTSLNCREGGGGTNLPISSLNVDIINNVHW